MSLRARHHVRRVVLAGLLVPLVGCGGGGPSGGSLIEAFDERAAAAYEEADVDRDENFNNGVPVAGCYIIDTDGATAVAEALGGADGDVELGEKNYLLGLPGEDERLTCGISADGDNLASVTAGTTLADADVQLDRLLRIDGAEEIDGDAPGLGDDDVVAVETEDAFNLAWVDERFFVALSTPSDGRDAEAAFEALAAAVESVGAELG